MGRRDYVILTSMIVTRSLIVLVASLLAVTAGAQEKLYRWVDSEGVVHFGDSIPAEYSELERQVVNEHGITVDVMHAKKTEEEL